MFAFLTCMWHALLACQYMSMSAWSCILIFRTRWADPICFPDMENASGCSTNQSYFPCPESHTINSFYLYSSQWGFKLEVRQLWQCACSMGSTSLESVYYECNIINVVNIHWIFANWSTWIWHTGTLSRGFDSTTVLIILCVTFFPTALFPVVKNNCLV